MDKVDSKDLITVMNQHFAERLIRRRVEQGLTPGDLDTVLSRPSGTISRLEKGRRSPDVYDLTALAAALDVSPEYFFEGIEQESCIKTFASPPHETIAEVEKFLAMYYRVKNRNLRLDILKLLRITAASPLYGKGDKPLVDN